MRMLTRIAAFLRNPMGWRLMETIANEVRTPECDLIGEYLFRLERDRFGRRRCRIEVQGALPQTPPRIVIGGVMAKAWVRTGELPAAWRDRPAQERWTAKPGVIAYG